MDIMDDTTSVDESGDMARQPAAAISTDTTDTGVFYDDDDDDDDYEDVIEINLDGIGLTPKDRRLGVWFF